MYLQPLVRHKRINSYYGCRKKSACNLTFQKEGFEDIKGAIRIRKSKDRQHNVQKKKNKYKQRSSTHYTEN